MRWRLHAITLTAVVALATVTDRAARAQGPHPELERGVTLYKGKDYFAASVVLMDVARSDGLSQPHAQQADFFLAKTLFQLRLFAASWGVFQRIISAGDIHAYYNAALKWNVALGDEMPLSDLGDGLRRIEAVLDQPVNVELADEVHSLLARLDIERAELASARERIERITPGSAEAARANLDLAVRENTSGTSAKAAAAARLAVDGALPRKHVARAHFELGRATNDDTALANAVKADANFHRRAVVAHLFRATPVDSVALESVLYRLGCGKRSPGTLIMTTRDQLTNMSKRYEDNAELYQVVVRPQGLGSVADLMLAGAIAPQLAYIARLESQIKIIDGADSAWRTSRVYMEVLEETVLVHAIAEADAGLLIRKAIPRLLDDLDVLVDNEHTWPPAGQDCRALFREPETPAAATPPPRQPKPKSGCAGCDSSRTEAGKSGTLVALFLLFACARFCRRRT